VHEQARKQLGINLKKPLTWPIPNRTEVNRYNAGEPTTDSPDKGGLRIDWFVPGQTLWTKHSTSVFAKSFCALHEKGAFPLLHSTVSPAKVAQVFKGYVMYLKRNYQAEVKSPQKAAERKREADRRSRSLNRREQVSFNLYFGPYLRRY
jgi:hypothetical protein